jgi:hypothetical protein
MSGQQGPSLEAVKRYSCRNTSCSEYGKPTEGTRCVCGSRKVRLDGDRIEVLFARTPLPASEPVHVFQHARKTGGTSIRSLIHRNLADSTDLETRYLPRKTTESILRESYGDLLNSLSNDQRKRLCWVISHSASHVVPFLDRPVRAFTIVREPVDRVLSRFWYPFGKTRTVEELSSMFAKLSRGRFQYSNYQSRLLLGPHHDCEGKLPVALGPPPDADIWRQRLFTVVDDIYTLLPNEHLDESFSSLSAEWGWNVQESDRHRVNTARPRLEDIEPELRERIRAYNWLDDELHRFTLDHTQRTVRVTSPGPQTRGLARSSP